MQAFLAGAMIEAQAGQKRQAASPAEPSRSKAPRTSSSGLPSASMSSARAMGKAQTKRQHFPAEPPRGKVPRISKPSTALPSRRSPPASTYEPSLVDYNATAELPRVHENWACNLDRIVSICPILGFKSGDALLAYLAEVVVFDAFNEWKNDKPAEGHPPHGSMLCRAAEEELLRPTVKFNQDPIDKTNWDQQQHKLLYILKLVRYGRLPGGIWENMSDADVPAMVHAALALLTWMTIHWRRIKRDNRDVAYKAILLLYNENLDNENERNEADEKSGKNMAREKSSDEQVNEIDEKLLQFYKMKKF